MESGPPTPLSTRLAFRQSKRDSDAAQLDPRQSSAKRTQALSSSFAQAGLERQLASLKTDKSELERKLKEKIAQVDRLEQDRRWLADREASERKEKEEDAARWEEEKSKVLSEMRALRTTLNATKESNADLEQSNAALASSAGAQKSQLSTLSRRAEFLEKELQRAQDLARQRDDEIQELKDQLIAQIPDGLSNKENNREDEAVIQAELVRQTTYLRDLERTNTRLTGEVTRLRERNTNIAVLQEEKRAIEAKLVTMEGLRARVAELELQLQSSVSSPSKITSGNSAATAHELSSLRLAHAQLLSQHEEKVDLEQRLSGVEIKLQASEGEIKFLQDLVASYVAESHANHETLGSAPTSTPAHLETLLMQYQTIKGDEERQRASRDGEALKNREVRLMETEISLEKEREKVKETEEREQTIHLAQIDSLEQELFQLRGEIAGGRHVPPGVRVLQLADNPESRWAEMRQAALDRLKSENEALLKRLRELEDLKTEDQTSGNTDDLVPRASWELVNQEKMELEEVVRQKEKRLLRLKEVYNAKGAEFRDAIASILGVKLTFRPNGEVRATSIYDLGASFMFQPARGTMQLVARGDGGPQDLPNIMKFWIAQEQCIPGFMATVMLECYENAKRKGGEDVV
ncbi:Spindle assembly checkpoint component mad1 [Termitomyces sp. J132]|nr:Spindle assembly checkpoint component mad1 [Termitomyces sp. J132]